MGKYVCIKECFYADRLWTPGENRILNSGSGKAPPENLFRPLGDVQGEKGDDFTINERHALIEQALSELDSKEDSHWTKRGLARIDIVEEKIKFETDRDELEKVWPGFNRDVTTYSKAPSMSPM